MNVSTIIPVFRRKGMIRKCVESALAQSVPEHEIVVTDNASDDGTWEYLQECYGTNTRVRLIRNASNLGPVRNWMRGVEEARGKYCHILFSDDWIESDFLSLSLARMDEDTGLVLVGHTKRDEERVLSTSTFQARAEYSREEVLEAGIFLNPARIQLVSPVNALFRTRDLRAAIVDRIPNSDGIEFADHGAGPDQLTFLIVASGYSKVQCVDRCLVTMLAHRESITVKAKDFRHEREWARWYFVKEHWPQAKRRYRTILFLRSRKLKTMRSLYREVCKDPECGWDWSYLGRLMWERVFRGATGSGSMRCA